MKLQRRHLESALMASHPVRLSAFNMASVALGLAFLYLPIAILGRSTRSTPRGWSRCGAAGRCAGTLNSSTIKRCCPAAWMSLRVAFCSATTIATVLGTLAALALARVKASGPHAVLRDALCRRWSYRRSSAGLSAAAAVRSPPVRDAASGP